MKKQKLTLLALCAALCLMSLNVQAQSTPPNTTDETNLDTQLHIILGTNQDVADSKLPSSLEPVIKQLRATLPFKNYRLAATLINRVKNEGRLDLSWIGGPMASTLGSAPTNTPSFSQFRVRQVKLLPTADGAQRVEMAGFYFGARIPIQTSG